MAQRWWESLNPFLVHQEFVEKFGIWAAGAQLNHDEVAAGQVLMEGAADEQG